MVTAPVFRHDDAGTPEVVWQHLLAQHPLPALELPDEPGRLMVVGAHPDDETLGASGLIHLAARRGWDVEVLCATAGESSHPSSPTFTPAQLADLRRRELDEAVGAVAPGAGVTCMRLPDGELDEHHEGLVDRLVSAIGTQGATTVLCAPWRSDGHPDHDAVGRAAALAAARTDARLLEYPVWLWHWGGEQDLPWADVRRLGLDADARAAKQRAVAAHRSQVSPLSSAAGDEVLLGPAVLAHFGRDCEVFVESSTPVTDDVLDRVHQERPDPWQVDSFYERRKRAVTLAALPRERYGRVLEVGCSIGALAVDLAARCDHLLALDSSATAVEAARTRTVHLDHVDVRQAEVPDGWPDGHVDLVSISEVGYFLSPRQLDAVVDRALASLTRDGHLLLCHWRHQPAGWPLAGPGVHAAFLARAGTVHVEHHEDDFLLHVLGRGAS